MVDVLYYTSWVVCLILIYIDREVSKGNLEISGKNKQFFQKWKKIGFWILITIGIFLGYLKPKRSFSRTT